MSKQGHVSKQTSTNNSLWEITLTGLYSSLQLQQYQQYQRIQNQSVCVVCDMVGIKRGLKRI